MNTSAPICISSYIKGGNPRPKGSQGASRRQASFNQTGAGYNVASNRRGNVSGGGPADLGIVAGQTMNLSRAQTNKESTAQRNSLALGAAIASSNSALNGFDEAMASGSMQPMHNNPRLQQ